MSRAKKEQRAVIWGRQVALLDASPGPLMVHGGGVWRIDQGAITAEWLLADGRAPPVSATRQTEQDLDRLRRAITFVGHGRSLGELADRGLPGMKRLRGMNLMEVTAEASRQSDCLAWALAAARKAPVGERPQGVLIEPSHLPPRRHDWGDVPSRAAVPPDLAVADRLLDIFGSALAERWVRSARECWWPERRLQSRLRLPCLQILLRTRHGSFAIGRDADLDCLRAVAALLGGADRAWADAASEFVPEWLRIGAEPARWLAEIPAALATDVLRHWPVPVPSRGWSRNSGGLKRYLVELEAAGAPGSAAGQWLRQQWVVELLTSAFADSVLAITAAAGRAAAGSEDAVSALVAGLSPGVPTVRRRLRDWAAPVTRDIDVPVLSDASGIEPDVLLDYLHYRRLAGEGERVPRDLARLVCSEDDEKAEASALRLQLERAELSEATRARLTRRVAYLGDPAARAARRAARRRRLRNQLIRASADYRLRSLRNVLEECARERLPDLRSGLPLSLLADLAWFVNDDRISEPLLRRFLEFALVGGSRYDWPENRRWINDRRGAFAVDRWVAGFDQTVQVVDQAVRYYTEADPIRAVHMGTWFGTCLALDDDGFNRFAALGNTVEANRHVIYATDKRGSVLARKLIAVAPPNRLLGYRTYAFANGTEHKRQLDKLCSEFARACGLTLSEVGTPEPIVDERLWYDDGPEPWLDERGEPISTARELLTDDEIEAGDHAMDSNLIHGLWLDGRLSASRRAALVGRHTWGHCDCALPVHDVPLFDPAGFAEAARRYRGEARCMGYLELRPDRALIDAATRVANNIDEPFLHLLSVDRALAYLRTAYAQPPGRLLLETLGVRGASQRRLRVGAVASTQRAYLEWGYDRMTTQAALADMRTQTASEHRLRQMLDTPALARQAATELVRRGTASCATAIGAASVRDPANETLALAAAAMGVGRAWDSARTVSSHADPMLVRLAVAAGTLPTPALRRARSGHDWMMIGHSELPPGDRKLRSGWEAVRDLAGAFLRSEVADWDRLASLLVSGPLVGSDPRVVHALAHVLSGPDDALLDCARAMGRAAAAVDPAGVSPAPGVLEVMIEAAARYLLGGESLVEVSEGVSALVQCHAPAAVGVLATLSELLPAGERLRALALRDADSLDPAPHLAWVFARDVRRAPELLDAIDQLDATTIGNMLAGLTRTLPTREAQTIAVQALARLAPDTQAQVWANLAEGPIPLAF